MCLDELDDAQDTFVALRRRWEACQHGTHEGQEPAVSSSQHVGAELPQLCRLPRTDHEGVREGMRDK